jgi:hypothetical protein
MPTFQLELASHEVTTRRLFNEALDRNHSMARHQVAQVFVANASYSLSVDRILKLAEVEPTPGNAGRGDEVRKALTQLVREKVLRSRRCENQTLYEVNY